MLNEIQEYRQYMSLTDNNILSVKDLAKGLTGLPRVYEVIARHAMFDESGRLISKWNETAKNDIMNWINNTLPTYVNALSSQGFREQIIDNLSPKVKTIKEKVNGKIEKKELIVSMEYRLNSKLFSENLGTFRDRTSDNNSVCFDTILADALDKGPLRNIYLVDKGDYRNKKHFAKLNTKGNIKNTHNEKDIDCIYKMTAAFLLANNNQDTALVTLVDVLNWGMFDKYDNYLSPGIHFFYKDTENSDPIEIYQRSNLLNNSIKLELNASWRENFELIYSEEEALTWKEKGAVVYKDQGHKLPLVEK